MICSNQKRLAAVDRTAGEMWGRYFHQFPIFAEVSENPMEQWGGFAAEVDTVCGSFSGDLCIYVLEVSGTHHERFAGLEVKLHLRTGLGRLASNKATSTYLDSHLIFVLPKQTRYQRLRRVETSDPGPLTLSEDQELENEPSS